MISDCRGRFTTAPGTLHAWRERQLCLVTDPVNAAKTSELSLTDDQTRETKNPPANIQLHVETGVM